MLVQGYCSSEVCKSLICIDVSTYVHVIVSFVSLGILQLSGLQVTHLHVVSELDACKLWLCSLKITLLGLNLYSDHSIPFWCRDTASTYNICMYSLHLTHLHTVDVNLYTYCRIPYFCRATVVLKSACHLSTNVFIL